MLDRGAQALVDEGPHPVDLLAAAGLTCLFGLQAIINLAVNLNLMPSKGMTLPFISYGGSSIMAFSLMIGVLLKLDSQRYTS